MKPALTRIVARGHELLGEVLRPGDLAVDLTAGNGHDTLMLYRLVGDRGRVFAFDIQAQALQNTGERLKAAGAAVQRLSKPQALAAGVALIAASHADLEHWLSERPQAVIANLGYLPGADQSIITRPESTLQALRAAAERLLPGGRMAIVVYPGHPGGEQEAVQVDRFFQALPESQFEVLCLRISNRAQAPYLQVAEKKTTS